MAKDLLLDQTGDLLFKNGDLVIGESDQQHVQDMLITNVGSNKAAPLFGIGLINYLNAPFTSSTRQKLKKEITLQLKADGARNVDVKVGETINVEAVYD